MRNVLRKVRFQSTVTGHLQSSQKSMHLQGIKILSSTKFAYAITDVKGLQSRFAQSNLMQWQAKFTAGK